MLFSCYATNNNCCHANCCDMLFLHCNQNYSLCTKKQCHSMFACAVIYSRCLHLCTLYTWRACLQTYHWLSALFCSPVCVMWLQEMHWQWDSPAVPSFTPISSEAERGTGVPAAALSAWPALKRHHHHRKRALKCRLVLSSGFPFTALWKPHSPQPDNSSRCLDGVQIAAYSLHTVRKAQS